MRNAEEHRKLLEQIAELERDNVNYFDVEREFFLIDSENLSAVQTRFYGYSIQSSGIYDADNLTEEAVAGLDGRGCYVYVEARDGQITIKQDLNGCWGIYLFRHGDYFALSNSFFRLLDHIKFRYPLTVNRDYCHYLLLYSYASYMYSETAVNEVRLVDRSAIIHIDAATKSLEMEMINYREQSISPDSEEGVATLDRWFDFWGKVFRGVAQHTDFFQADLSGGFDSRISFVPLVSSGVNLDDMQINSINDKLHTHAEDYKIATQIAEHYGFRLNKSLPERQFLNYSLTDVFNSNLYSCQTFANIPRLESKKSVYKLYSVNGAGGETIRDYFRGAPETFIKNQTKLLPNTYPAALIREMSASIEKILKADCKAICDKYGIEDPNFEYIVQHLFLDGMCRHHFGKGWLMHYFQGNVRLSPIIDPELRTLRFYSEECSDPKLLTALIFTRYEPDLLKFPFDSKHFIEPETIAYAKKISERFPFRATTNDAESAAFHLYPINRQAEKIIFSGHNNKPLPVGFPDKCLKAAFDSSKTYSLFTSCFDEEIYHNATFTYYTQMFRRFRPMYAVTGIARVLEDAEISQQNNRPPYQSMKRFIEQDFCEIHDDAQIIRKFRLYFTARIDLQFTPKTNADALQVLSVSDNSASVLKPDWFQNGRVGYVISSYSGKLEIVAKAVANGKLQVDAKGIDMRRADDNSKRIPYWVDYTRFTVNRKTLINALTPAWHDKPYRYTIDVKAGDEITIAVEWLPHRSDT